MSEPKLNLTPTEVLMECMDEIANPTDGYGTVDKIIVILHHTSDNVGNSGIESHTNIAAVHEKLGIVEFVKQCLIEQIHEMKD